MPFYDDNPSRRRRHGENTDEWTEDRRRPTQRRYGPSADVDSRDNRDSRSGSYSRDSRASGNRYGSDRAPRREDGRGSYSRDRDSFGRDNRDSRGSRPNSDRAPRRDDRGSFSRDRDSFSRSNDRRYDDRTPRRERPATQPAAPKGHADFEYRPAPITPAPLAPARPEFDTAEDKGYMLVGRNPIREALKNGRDLEKMLVMKGELSGSARQIVQQAKEARVPVQVVDKARLDELTPHHQGLVAFASAYPYATVEDMLAVAQERGEDPFLIILDGVTDPHNLGAVIRSAECVGAHGVIVRERRSVGLTPAAVKASAGAVEYMKVARVTNLNRTLEQLKQQGVWVYALTMEGQDYRKADLSGPVALVVGSEGEGISRLTLENCDQQLSLPLKGHIDSLNASVAAGVVLYQVLACRTK